MLMTLQGAVLSLKTASDIAKGFLHLQSLAENQGKVIELNEAILSAQSSAITAQSEHFAMVERVRDLEKEITRKVGYWLLVCPILLVMLKLTPV